MADAAAVHGERLELSEGLISIDSAERINFWSDFIAGCLAGRLLT